MRRHLLVAAFALIAAVGVVAQSSAAAPAKSYGAFAVYANVGSGWWGGSDFEQFITDYQAFDSAFAATGDLTYSVGILDRIGGNPLYFEIGIGFGGFTGGFSGTSASFSVNYFSFPYEMSLGLAIPMGKTIALMAQAGLVMDLHLSADYNFWSSSSGTDSGTLESDYDFAFLALSIPVAAGIEITLSPSFKIDILAIYQFGVGDLNFLDTSAVFTPSQYWSNLTENAFSVRCSLVFPFAPPKTAGGSVSQPSTGVQR